MEDHQHDEKARNSRQDEDWNRPTLEATSQEIDTAASGVRVKCIETQAGAGRPGHTQAYNAGTDSEAGATLKYRLGR